jgi:hypothetical protein
MIARSGASPRSSALCQSPRPVAPEPPAAGRGALFPPPALRECRGLFGADGEAHSAAKLPNSAADCTKSSTVIRASSADKARLHHHRQHHALEQRSTADWRAVQLDGRAGGAQYIIGRDTARLACKLVAATRSARSFENAVTHQRLQHRLEMPR